MYLNSFNYFRGISIVFIVAGHCLYMSGWTVDTVTEKFVANLILGGTSFFVFISGFLFHHIFYPRYRSRPFMLAKAKNVLVPYLVMSLPLILYYVAIKGTGPYPENFFGSGTDLYTVYLLPVLKYLWTGRILDAYWYIPFIMIIFAASPLVIIFIRLQSAYRLLILTVLLTVALFIQRPVLNISVLQSVAYFLPVYLFGIVVSIHREQIYTRLQGRETFLLAAVLLLALLQAVFYDSFGNMHKPPLQPAKPDLLLLQKLFFCLFFMIFLHRFEEVSSALLSILAAASFAIYFIHPYLLWWLQVSVLNKGYHGVTEIQGPILWVVLTAGVILLSTAAALAVRGVFRSHSRAVIGW